MNFEINYYNQYESSISVLHFTYKCIDIVVRVRCHQDVEEFITKLEVEEDTYENFTISYNDLYIHKVHGEYTISNYSELYDKYSFEYQSYWEYRIKPKVITKLIEVLKNGPTLGRY